MREAPRTHCKFCLFVFMCSCARFVLLLFHICFHPFFIFGFTHYKPRYVASQMKKQIEIVGPKRVFLVVIDGGSDWAATEEMVQGFFPWISFMHCVSHEVSLIIKDCFKEVGGVDELRELDEWITDAQHWFSSHACSAFVKQQAVVGEKTAFVWPAVTRYCGLLLKIKRFLGMQTLLRRVVQSGVYVEKNFVDDPHAAKIVGPEVWQMMKRVTDMLGPLLLLCRLADGQKPVISKLYGTQLHVRNRMELLARDTDDDSVEKKILSVFLRRWPELQSDIVSATYLLDPLFVEKSRAAAGCTIILWRLARKVIKINYYFNHMNLHI